MGFPSHKALTAAAAVLLLLSSSNGRARGEMGVTAGSFSDESLLLGKKVVVSHAGGNVNMVSYKEETARTTLPRPSPTSVGSHIPLPFMQPSACPYQMWRMTKYRCYWKVVGPDTKVALAFGLIAAQKYGTDISLRQGLAGKGSTYRTLLREATTALLNSYNSIEFYYPTLSVLDLMNLALLGSPRQALLIALKFRRANSGASHAGRVRCNFRPCH